MPSEKQILAAYALMRDIVAMCVAGKDRKDIDRELNKLSALTRVRRTK